MQLIGISDSTSDPEYDLHREKFDKLVEDTNEVGAALTDFVVKQKENWNTGRGIASTLHAVYEGFEAEATTWPGTHTEGPPPLAGQAKSFSDAWNTIQDVIRPSAAMVVKEMGIDPLRSSVNDVLPLIKENCRLRDEYIKDFDSYRRRLKDIEVRLFHSPNPAM